ncbi:protein maelstrom homolog [Ooceraea biroi]|uniref:protein maelstrom homolog n=1 Tax=Ooceraea biroi TaxID=2015173 RepID=UPI0005BB614B|nr:protein maelstrom homolog [Ooceraea biroi]
MPKNKYRNAFFFFMLDWKKRAEARGKTFPNGMKDVQADQDCNKEWQNLTKQQKGLYEAMAKKDKVLAQGAPDKKTTLGESIKMLEEKEKEGERSMKEMEENIKITIDMAVNLNILPKIKFCFMHVNWFFATIVDNRVEYFPAEYALGVFSLENGIEDVHQVIVSSKIPLGYRREALETSQSGHQIPVEHEGGETDFTVMYAKLINFLEPRKLVNKFPPIYTLQSDIGPVQSLLAKLCDAAEQDVEQFKIYELETLFIHVAKEAYKARNDRQIKYIPAYAYHVFTRYTYIFETGFECPFHKYVERGSEYCSKSKLHQWAWTMCDEFCLPLGVKMQEGVHCPVKRDVAGLTNALINLNVEDNYQPAPESSTILSMTGVSEQHKWKASSRTYQDEIRRRHQSTPIAVIDYSAMGDTTDVPANESDNESLDKSGNISFDERRRRRNLMHYLNERRVQSSADSYADACASATVEDLIPNDCENFPPIGGRGVSCRANRVTKKAPLGRGRGYV